MDHWSGLGVLIVTLNNSVNIVGKIWFMSIIMLRMAVIVLAGYPLYQDEQERFVCNTLQPGCANVCYDTFSPVSHFRFWLAQVLCVLLPHALFNVYVLSEVAAQYEVFRITTPGMAPSPLTGSRANTKADNWEVPNFSGPYLVHLFFRTIAEVGFSAGQYFLFGFSVPKTFRCFETPCTGSIECYVSRPTEKSLMMIFMWVVSGFSVLLTVLDVIYVACKQARMRSERHRLLMMESDFAKDGRCSAALPQPSFADSPKSDQNRHCSRHHDFGKKREDPVCDYSPSFRPDEDEGMSIDFGVSPKNTARSNINSNSNKNACSLQVSLTPPGSSLNALWKTSQPSIFSNRGPGDGRKEESDVLNSVGNTCLDTPMYTKCSRPGSLAESIRSTHSHLPTSAYIKSQKSEWV